MGLFQAHVRHRNGHGPSDVTNRVAIWLAVFLIGLVIADRVWLGWDLHLLTGRYIVSWIDYLAFWR